LKSRLTVWGALAPLAVVAAWAGSSGCGGGASAADAGPLPPTPVTVTVDPTTRYQVMVGFGAASAYFANYPSIHPSSAAIYQTLFNDLGLEVLRIGNWYQNGNDNGASLAAAATLVAGATATLGHTPIILMSSWNPSIALKSNGIDDAGGTLVKAAGGGYDYAGFGQWWSAGLAAYAAAGVVPDYVSIQNEPDFTTTNEGTCLFDPSEDPMNAGYGAALDAVRQAIAANPGQPMPKFVGPETSGIAKNEVPTYLTGIGASGQLDDLDVVAHHLYNGGTDTLPNTFNASMTGIAQAAGNRPIWMTEYAPNNPNMFDTAWLIQNSVTVEGVSTYLYWDLFWPAPPAGSTATPQGLVSIESPGNPNSWQTPNGFFINDVYYAVQHFAKWIDVGWQRIAAASSDGSVLASAFVSPDGTHLTLVLLNIDGPDCLVTIDPGTGGDGGAAPFATTAVYRTSGTTERATPLGPLQTGNTFDLPGLGIATVTFGP
jgi:glucuronoarabinoxylan endo-1,4-beta-xylanase